MAWRGVVFLVALAGASLVSAQQPARQPDFRSDVNLVTLDVIPRTSTGQFVADLTRADFRVLEDGVAQEVASLVLVHGGRVFNLAQPVVAAPAVDGLILPATKPRDDAAGRVFVFIVDDLHFTAIETPLARALLRKVIGGLLQPGDSFAMFSTGPSSIEIPMTYDRASLEAAVSRVAGRGMSYRDIMDSRDGALGPQGLRQNAHVAFRTAYELLGNLERVRGRRKALILISTGYDFDPFPQGRSGSDQVFGGRFGTPWADPSRGERFLTLEQEHNRFADGDLASELAALAGAANRVNASIYALDPRGVAGTIDLGDNVDIGEMRTYITKTQSSLRALAEATGGIAVVNDNDYTGAIKRIDAETSDYYILGYYAANNDPARRDRRVEVTATRPGLQVWSRGWYRTRSAATSPKPRP